MRKPLVVGVAFSVFSLAAPPINATTIQFDGTLPATLNDPNGLFDSVLGYTPSGAAISATLTYSPTMTPLTGPTPFFGPGSAFYTFAPSDLSFELHINGTTLAPIDDDRTVTIFNGMAGADLWSMSDYFAAANGHRLGVALALSDSTGSFTNDPNVFKLPEPIGTFDSAFIRFIDVGATSLAFVGDATGSVRQVPEPAIFSLLGIGLLGLGLRRARLTGGKP